MAIPGAFYESAKLLALLPASWFVPIGRLWPLAKALRRWRGRYTDRPAGAALVLAHLLADQVTPEEAAAIYRRWQDRWLDLTLHILALRRPLRRWRPAVRLTGRRHLEAALGQGAGAILWLSDFIYSPIILPRTLSGAGFPLTLLSRPEHGFSVVPFGIRFLNPFWQQVENRSLVERVVIENNDAKSSLQRLRERLGQNGIVAIAVAESGRRTLDPAFFCGRLRMASGPLHLARTTGAPILPATAVRHSDGSYEVAIEPALEIDGAEPLYHAAARAYTQGLEHWVRRYPDQWNGWIALGRLVENAPGFAQSFACAAALGRDLAAAGEIAQRLRPRRRRPLRQQRREPRGSSLA
jgi:lauroyl/myristoyl acyltransferase